MPAPKIQVIINPASGSEEPILSYLNSGFKNSGILWDVSLTHESGDAERLAAEFAGKVDVIAVYGGDGSITEAARGLRGSNTPLAIIPGGTANVLAKELGIPTDSKMAIKTITNGGWHIKSVDAGSANGELFLIRVNFGIMADMILETSRSLKDKMGQAAYGVTAFKTLLHSKAETYTFEIDGSMLTHQAVAVTVTNCGNIGIADYTLVPGIKADDGQLDLIALESADLLSLMRVASSTLTQNDSKMLLHRSGKKMNIRLSKEQAYLLDDCERRAEIVEIEIIPGAIQVILPQS